MKNADPISALISGEHVHNIVISRNLFIDACGKHEKGYSEKDAGRERGTCFCYLESTFDVEPMQNKIAKHMLSGLPGLELIARKTVAEEEEDSRGEER